MWDKAICGGKAKLTTNMGKHKLHIVYKLEQNMKSSLLLNFEVPTSPPIIF